MSDCACITPKPTEMGVCERCGGFACPYAGRGRTRCSTAICDCFIDTHPDDPFGLHPEDFLVAGHRYDLEGHMTDCPGCHATEDQA